MSSAQPPVGNALPPAPEAGTPRFFALLYTPRPRRPALLRLLGLADELGAGVARGLDHDVAHARLEWWRHEAARYAAGLAQHPWLRALPGETPGALQEDLPALLVAATLDLAESLHGAAGQRLRGALFLAAAKWLGADALAPAQRAALAQIGSLCWRCEQASQRQGPAAAQAVAPTALSELLQQLGRAAQSALAPLLVWAALAARAAESGSRRRAFADNIRAWSVARRAAAGTLTRL